MVSLSFASGAANEASQHTLGRDGSVWDSVGPITQIPTSQGPKD